jgi:hypothetical protein
MTDVLGYHNVFLLFTLVTFSLAFRRYPVRHFLPAYVRFLIYHQFSENENFERMCAAYDKPEITIGSRIDFTVYTVFYFSGAALWICATWPRIRLLVLPCLREIAVVWNREVGCTCPRCDPNTAADVPKSSQNAATA